MKVTKETKLVEKITQVKEDVITLTLSAEEARVLRACFGRIGGIGTTSGSVTYELYQKLGELVTCNDQYSYFNGTLQGLNR